MNAEELRIYLGLKSVQTIYRWVKSGVLNPIPFGTRNIRFKTDDAENILLNGTKQSRLIEGKPGTVRSSARSRRRKRAWE